LKNFSEGEEIHETQANSTRAAPVASHGSEARAQGWTRDGASPAAPPQIAERVLLRALARGLRAVAHELDRLSDRR
jgi:hypothetical protein